MTPLPTVQSQSPVNKGGTANVMLILRQIPGFKETFDNQVIHFLKWNGFKSPTIHDFEDTSAQLSLCIYRYHITLGDKRRLPIIFNLFSHNLTWSIYNLKKTRISFDMRDIVFKGQIISECPYEIIVYPKIATKKFLRFLPWPLRRGQIKKIKALYYTN